MINDEIYEAIKDDPRSLISLLEKEKLGGISVSPTDRLHVVCRGLEAEGLLTVIGIIPGTFILQKQIVFAIPLPVDDTDDTNEPYPFTVPWN